MKKASRVLVLFHWKHILTCIPQIKLATKSIHMFLNSMAYLTFKTSSLCHSTSFSICRITITLFLCASIKIGFILTLYISKCLLENVFGKENVRDGNLNISRILYIINIALVTTFILTYLYKRVRSCIYVTYFPSNN